MLLYVKPYKRAAGIPVFSTGIDPFFENVVSLMHMNDAGLTDTVTGNSWSIVNAGSISNAQAKFGASSYNVPNSGWPYLKNTNAGMLVGTSDFTVEFFVYCNAVSSGYQYMYASFDGGTFHTCILNGKINVYFGGTWHDMGNVTMTAGSWHHVAFVRENGTIFSFLDGSMGTNSYSHTGEITASNACCLGSQPVGVPYSFNGYIDEFRFTKGIARYMTGGFAPTTAAFTDGRDNSVDPYLGYVPYLAHYNSSATQVDAGTCTAVVTGSVSIDTVNTKFGAGSLGFATTGRNYLTLSPYSNFNFNGDFTVECWVRPLARTDGNGDGLQTIFSHANGGNDFTIQMLSLMWSRTTGKMSLDVGHSDIWATGTAVITAGTWAHVAFTRSGNTYTVYVNGIVDITGTYATNFSTSAFSTDIGRAWYYAPTSPTEYFRLFAGNIDGFRITNKCRYNRSFAVPTSAYTNILENGYDPYLAETVFNFPFDSDCNSTVKGYEGSKSGGQLSAGKFGNCFEKLSAGDVITLPNGPYAALTNKEFTIDGWFNNPGSTGYGSYIISCWRESGTTKAWAIYFDASNNLFFCYTTNGSTNISFGTTAAPSLNVWHHFAVVRHKTAGFAIFIDGALAAGWTASSNVIYTSVEPVVIGGTANNSYSLLKLDDIRLTVGACRYGNPFIPKTSANIAADNTASTLLMHFNNNLTDVYGHSVDTNNGVTFNASTFKFGTHSAAFNGTSQNWMHIASSSDFAFRTGDFTIEFWMQTDATNKALATLIDFRTTQPQAQPCLTFANNGKVNYLMNSSTMAIASSTITTGTWYHVALSRCNGTSRLYLNGVLQGSVVDNNDIGTTGIFMGANYLHNDALTYFGGVIDELRISPFARYTGNSFIPLTNAFEK